MAVVTHTVPKSAYRRVGRENIIDGVKTLTYNKYCDFTENIFVLPSCIPMIATECNIGLST